MDIYDIFGIEEELNIIIPEEYKCMLLTTDLGLLNMEYFDPNENFMFRATKWLECIGADNKIVKIDSFLYNNQLIDYWKTYNVMKGAPLSYIPIALTSLPHNGLLLIGVRGEFFEKIYVSEGGNGEISFFDKNLSSLLSSLTKVYNDKQILLDGFYKNYNESFWRIK